MSIVDTSTNMLINTNQYNETKIKQIAESANNKKDDKALLKACQDFESIFTHILLKSMRSTIPESELIEKSTATEMFEDMYDQELASTMSTSKNGLGIAQLLYNQMKRNL
ncbi:rod-binding protein [Proteiniborus sp. MB09-C3]|uniref:rod-binding protein n=1 Tax=Proteiniborus sp. MB09-C3 TaxID=3050072 RepID=UPI00255757E8|nr:rod-binding protein [Proteiniborus sp. MB09-C3]WIV12157.1 rod-binding protein [Proteiniborus sp. MB09-C3]